MRFRRQGPSKGVRLAAGMPGSMGNIRNPRAAPLRGLIIANGEISSHSGGMAMPESEDLAELLGRAGDGDETAVNELFSRYRKRLKQMVRLRLNPLLQRRVDTSDILQEAYLEAARRLPDYLVAQPLPIFLWLRQITGEKIIDVHRRHL